MYSLRGGVSARSHASCTYRTTHRVPVGSLLGRFRYGSSSVRSQSRRRSASPASSSPAGGSTRSRRRRESTTGTSAVASGRKNSQAYSRLRSESLAAGAECVIVLPCTHPAPSTRSSVLSAELGAAASQSPKPASALSSCSSSVAAAPSPLALNTTSPPATVSTSRTVPSRVPLSACTTAKPSSAPEPPWSARKPSSEGVARRSRSGLTLPLRLPESAATRSTAARAGARTRQRRAGARATRRAAGGGQCGTAGAAARAAALMPSQRTRCSAVESRHGPG